MLISCTTFKLCAAVLILPLFFLSYLSYWCCTETGKRLAKLERKQQRRGAGRTTPGAGGESCQERVLLSSLV